MCTASADPPGRSARACSAPGARRRGGRAYDGIVLAGIGDEAAADLPGQLAALRALGWRHLELRGIGGVPVAALDEAAFARAAELIRAAGVTVVGVASKIGDWSRPITGDFAADLGELRVLAGRCAALGTRLVRVMSYPSGGLAEPEWGRRARARLRDLARRAEDAGLVLAHENCAGWAGDRADRMLDLLADVDSPALRLLFDTGNGVPYGYASAPLLAAVIEHVVHVHVKDAVAGPDGRIDYVPPGTGDAGVADCLRLLLAHGYTGALSLEPHVHLRPHLAAAGRAEPPRGGRPSPAFEGAAARPNGNGVAGAGTSRAAAARPATALAEAGPDSSERENAVQVLTAARPEGHETAGPALGAGPRATPRAGGDTAAAGGSPYHEEFVTFGRALERLLTDLSATAARPPVTP